MFKPEFNPIRRLHKHQQYQTVNNINKNRALMNYMSYKQNVVMDKGGVAPPRLTLKKLHS